MNSFREERKAGEELVLSGTSYIIANVVGSGSNAICYRASYDDSSLSGKKHYCLIKELFPLSERALIRREEGGNIYVAPEGLADFELHKRSFMRGCSIGIDLNDKRPDKSMTMFNTNEAYGTVYAVIGNAGGVPLEQTAVGTLKEAAEITVSILHALRPFHTAGLWHLDISPKNILLMPMDAGEKTYRILLIDYNSVFSSMEIKEKRNVYLSVNKPFTAPEVILGYLSEIGAAADLFSVTAVFARLLCPDYRGDVSALKASLPVFENMPQTAIHKARRIAWWGLQPYSGNRYQTIDGMLSDFRELLDRIDCAGVTLPALWEASAARYKSAVSSNPQLAYLSDNEIPTQLSVRDFQLHTLITGDGGMGKTTALLRIWQNGVKKYNATTPVSLYIRLNDYSREKSIRMRCLDRLRFTEATSTEADALKALDDIFNKPDSVLLLLDGLNETAHSQRDALIAEIVDLCKYSGLRIAVSSRSDVTELTDFQHLSLESLTEKFVRDYLNTKSLLFPSREALRGLLTNPMMLTMYVAVAVNANTPFDSFDESTLIKAYLEYIVSKSNTPVAAEFAVKVLLPRIGAVMSDQKVYSVLGTQIYKCVVRLYMEMKEDSFFKEFPEYLGESAALLMGAGNAEEWFGFIINKLLRRELALLIKTESEQYSFAHQIYRDYFANDGRDVKKRLRKVSVRRCLPKMIFSFAIAVVLICGIGISFYKRSHMPPIFPSTEAEIKVVDDSITMLEVATGFFDLSLMGGESAIEFLREPPLSGDWNSILTELEKNREKDRLFYVLDEADIDKYVFMLEMAGNTIPRDTYHELCGFSGKFLKERDMILEGLTEKMLLLNNPQKMSVIYDDYLAWSDNKAMEYILLLRHTIDALPVKYQEKLLRMRFGSLSLTQHVRDDIWISGEYEVKLQKTREIDAKMLSGFRESGVLIK